MIPHRGHTTLILNSIAPHSQWVHYTTYHCTTLSYHTSLHHTNSAPLLGCIIVSATPPFVCGLIASYLPKSCVSFDKQQTVLCFDNNKKHCTILRHQQKYCAIFGQKLTILCNALKQQHKLCHVLTTTKISKI